MDVFNVCEKAQEKMKEIREEYRKEQEYKECIIAGVCPNCGNDLNIAEEKSVLRITGGKQVPKNYTYCSCGFRFNLYESK